MNVKRASIFVGAVAGFAMSGMATAEFQGMAYQNVRTGAEGTTYRIYAILDDGDRLDAVAGNGQQELSMTSINGFYQNVFSAYLFRIDTPKPRDDPQQGDVGGGSSTADQIVPAAAAGADEVSARAKRRARAKAKAAALAAGAPIPP